MINYKSEQTNPRFPMHFPQNVPIQENFNEDSE